jgi:nicotinamide riboside transporter PnuC
MLEVIGYLATMIALTGVVLNVKKIGTCFILWSISNLIFAVLNGIHHRWYEVILFTVQFFIALWGLYEWVIKQKREEVRF